MPKLLHLPALDANSIEQEVEQTLALLNEAGRILAYVDGQLNIQTVPDMPATVSEYVQNSALKERATSAGSAADSEMVSGTA